jgi:hypothetical protein
MNPRRKEITSAGEGVRGHGSRAIRGPLRAVNHGQRWRPEDSPRRRSEAPSSVIHLIPKLNTRVRFPSSALRRSEGVPPDLGRHPFCYLQQYPNNMGEVRGHRESAERRRTLGVSLQARSLAHLSTLPYDYGCEFVACATVQSHRLTTRRRPAIPIDLLRLVAVLFSSSSPSLIRRSFRQLCAVGVIEGEAPHECGDASGVATSQIRR